MMKKIIFAFILCVPFILNAAESLNKGQEKSVMCGACHGPQGISTNPEWPNLAGQHATYLIKQLHDFKQGVTRNAATMTPMVANLTEEDIQDIANFYAKQTRAQDKTPQQYQTRGEQLYKRGDFDKHITACIACHGPLGTGNAQAGFPVLSGQHAQYSVLQMQAFKDKNRSNDLNSIMRDISARMNISDMQAVAHYLAGLH